VGKRVRATGGGGVGKQAATAIQGTWPYSLYRQRCVLADWPCPVLSGQLASVGVENTEDNRRRLRELLVGTAQCENHLSGVVRLELKPHACSALLFG